MSHHSIPNELTGNFAKYKRVLISCIAASEAIYDENPMTALNSGSFNALNHIIRKSMDSKIDDENSNDPNSLEVKYMVSECEYEIEKEKVIIVAFRGSQTRDDYLIDLKLNGKVNELEGRFHSGMFQRSVQIPIDYFIDKLKKNYKIVFTGHSLGAAVAALVCIRVLFDNRVKSDWKKNILCIGFGTPAFADTKFKDYVKKSECENNFHFYINEKDIVVELLTKLSNALYDESFDQNSGSNAESFLSFITSNLSGKVDESLLSSSLKFLATKVLPVVGKVLIPKYEHFGRTIFLNGGIKISGYSESSSLKKDIENYLKRPDDLISKIQNHYIGNYRRKFSQILKHFEYNHTRQVLKLPDFELPKQISLREGSCKKDDTGNCDNNDFCNQYSIKLLQNEFKTDVCISVCCRNMDYILNAFLKNKNDAKEIFGAKIQNESCGSKKFTFSDLNPSIHELKNEYELTFKTHFEHSDPINITFSENNLIDTKLKHKNKKILTMQVDLLYLYAIFYCNTFERIKDLEGKSNASYSQNCNAIRGHLERLSKIWNDKFKEKEKEHSEEELKGVFFSYFVEDFKKTDQMKEQKFSLKFVENLKDFVCENDLEKVFDRALLTCYYLKKLQSNNFFRSWDKNTAFYLNIFNVTLRNLYYFAKSYFNMTIDEGYLATLQSFNLPEFDEAKFTQYAGSYEEIIIAKKRLGNLKLPSFENNKIFLESVEINYEIRKILMGDFESKISIFGVIGKLK